MAKSETIFCEPLAIGCKIEILFPLNSYKDFSVIQYIKCCVVALFSVNPMNSVNLMSVKVMHDCIKEGHF